MVDTSAKPHQCSACGRGFARPDALTRHSRVHRPRSITASPADGSAQSHPIGSDRGFESHVYSSQASRMASANQELHQESTSVVPSESYLDTVISDTVIHSERRFYRPLDSAFASNSSGRTLQHISSTEPSPDTLVQGACSTELPMIDRPLPQWSGMESQWMVSLGSPAAYVPAVTPEILRRALVETISLAGSAVSLDLPSTITELMLQLDPALFTDRWLITCHRLFWVKVLPIVPVLHGPTMQCSKIWAPLLISMSTLGSLHIEGVTSKAKVSMVHLRQQDDLTFRVSPCGEWCARLSRVT